MGYNDGRALLLESTCVSGTGLQLIGHDGSVISGKTLVMSHRDALTARDDYLSTFVVLRENVLFGCLVGCWQKAKAAYAARKSG